MSVLVPVLLFFVVVVFDVVVGVFVAKLVGVCWLVGWLGRWLVCWLVGWLVCWLIGWFIGWLVGSLVGWLVGLLVGWLVGCLMGQLVGLFVGWVGVLFVCLCACLLAFFFYVDVLVCWLVC